MSIRLTFLYLCIAGLSLYAWKDWFKSLCGLILLMAIIEHEGMPKTILGIQGLNLWNVLFAIIVLAWAASRAREGLTWDMPRHIVVLLLLYLGVILVGVLRAVLDHSYIENYPLKNLLSEELVNTIKWTLPGLLLFDGCRTRHRVIMALTCLLVMYLLMSVEVIRRMPYQAVLSMSDAITQRRVKLDKFVGYNACDLSAMLAGVSWALVATLPLIWKKKWQALVLAAAGMTAYAQALTGGRAGYVAWGVTGLTLCILKWRKYLLLAPVAVILLAVVLPGVATRMLGGFGEADVTGGTTTNMYDVTSGRAVMWPHVIDKIGQSPLVGYGRLAMKRTGLTNQLVSELGEAFAHPHNMYLETLLDNGLLGSLPILAFWAVIMTYSARLFRRSNRLYSAVGGLALSLTLAQFVAGLGAQHFYPKESTLGMWAATFLMLRVYFEEARAQAGTNDLGDAWSRPVEREPLQEVVAAGVS